MKTELYERLDDAFEPTPQGFHYQLTSALKHPQPARWRGFRVALACGLCIALVCGTAAALDRIGILYFFSERMADGPTAVWLQTSGSVVLPVSQNCESQVLDMSVRDVYLSADEIAICVHIAPKNTDAYRLLSETDIGTDGESFDHIWWNGEILSFDEWLPEGKEMLIFSDRYLEIGGQPVSGSMDWVPEAAGETFLFRAELWQLENDLQLNNDGTLTIRLAVDSRIYGEENQETGQLTCAVPIVEEWKEE